MHLPTSKQLVFAWLPAAVIVRLVYLGVVGENGLLQRQALSDELAHTRIELADVHRANNRLVFDVQRMDRSPAYVRQAVAQELGWVADGATVYRLPDADGAVRSLASNP